LSPTPDDAAYTAALDRLAAVVGPAYALRDAADHLPYTREWRGLFPGVTPLVLRPGSVEEVAEICRIATETGVVLVPQGGNTGLVGGGMPDGSGREVVVSVSRLNRIRDLDPVSNTVTVEAGVVLQSLHEAADAADRMFPLTLASQGSCEVGGNLSTNAGGTAVLAYGNARDLCLGLEVVLPTGEVLDDLRRLKKDNTGYDLKNLFVGAEGTLGIITAAVLKIFPKPKGREVALAAVPTPEAALDLFNRAGERAGAGLTAFELIGRMPIDFVLAHVHGAVDPLAERSPWYVLLEVSSGRSADDARATIEDILAEGFEAGVVSDAAVAGSIAQANDFWRLREGISEAQKPEGASIKHDISVPVALIPQFIHRAAEAVERVSRGARVICFGHMGDGNLHYNVTRPAGEDNERYLSLYKAMNTAVHDIVRDLDGSISAEHGIGRLKRDELAATAPPFALDLMRRVKAAFDPAGIMNPNKVI
jgi:FAD/FMN-containing dehydrogenase